MSIIDKVENLAERFLQDECRNTYYDSLYDEEKEESIEFDEALTELLTKEIKDSDLFSIDTSTTFESCGYDCGVISVAFYDKTEGLLHHETYMWERI